MDPKNRLNEDVHRVHSNIERVRSRAPRLKDERVTLAHGAGGKASAALVEQVFVSAYESAELRQAEDAALLTFPGSPGEGDDGSRIAFSTDSYVVDPLEFPGGSIGDLAVNGTVNDLAVSGALPEVISAAFILEEGLEIAVLRRIVADMHAAAEKAGVRIVTGDTKVVPRGHGDGVYITTAGMGRIPASVQLDAHGLQPGDRILCSGPIADHGMAVMMARGDLAISAPIESDTRAINGLTAALLDAAPHTRWMRDATRGGVATVMNECAQLSGLGIVLEDQHLPVRDMTRAACDMLGIDPLYVANEGTFLAVVPAEEADAGLDALHAAGAPEACAVGRVAESPAAQVALVTGFGGTRMVDMLVGDPLPRIC
ncbi:hydrogenase expression/formation protein HypE [Corynebacterium uropygiale]|uniref:Hydrogenase expression/formation protein HypE n=1 Tax=Corynebacterium uropygiale TaxID=1775911 RepID=A0A9X1QSU2_9CORY|nr:hydrogenase expression/formation protein HypE [Corynebacterium uropygiale]MCF4007178.1 hydrogenase expression/formation protein HypE [Corynebacterium uropygiale]